MGTLQCLSYMRVWCSEWSMLTRMSQSTPSFKFQHQRVSSVSLWLWDIPGALWLMLPPVLIPWEQPLDIMEKTNSQAIESLIFLIWNSTVCTLGLSSSKTGPLAPPIICHSEAQRPQPDFSELGPLSPQLPWLSLQSLLASSSGHPTCLVLTSSTCSCFLPQKHKDQYGRAGHCWRVGSEWETKSLNFQPTQGWAKLELLTD